MQLLTTVLDWCFPPRADELLVRQLQPHDITPTPTYPARHTVCLLPFTHPTVAALIHEAKFHYNQRAHHILGACVAHYLREHHPAATLIPVPLHPIRERERGFNQVTACLRTHATLRTQRNPHVLKRIRHTKPQTSLSAEDRATNVRQAFVVRTTTRSTLDPDQPIIIIDDVYTTGATIQAARTAVRAAFPTHTVYCLTFAYA